MRRTTGAILMLMRPLRISRSAWRGEARKASKPKRATSTRAATIDIISIAQQARPNVAGNMAFPRAQLTALSSVVVMMDSWTYCSSSMGVFNNYAIVPADKFMPVDVHVPGCPPRPEALMHGVLKLRAMIQGHPDQGWRQRYGAVGTEEVVGAKAADAINVFGPGDTEGA